MIITPERFDRIRTIHGCLPQTTVGPGKSIIVSIVQVDEGDELNVRWQCMHVLDFIGVIRSSGITTGAKTTGSPATVTASEAFFTSTDVGSIITWASGEQTYISGYISATSVSVTNVSGLTNPATGVVTGYFSLQPSIPNIINTGMGGAVCGIVSTSPELFDLPGGCPESMLSTSAVGVVASSPYTLRRYVGDDRIAIMVMNNTHNFDLQVAVGAAMQHISNI